MYSAFVSSPASSARVSASAAAAEPAVAREAKRTDVGADGLYGYCATDDPGASAVGAAQKREVSAYCVVDDDFDPAQYPAATGEQALAVTAAHEFFHAVQFGYDWREDLWFMEGTAAWVEDEVYDDVNENVLYLLKASALRHPAVPVDLSASGFQYGSWSVT